MKRKKFYLISLGITMALIFIISFSLSFKREEKINQNFSLLDYSEVINEVKVDDPDFYYLSELDYLPGSKAGWGSIGINKNPEGNPIKLMVTGRELDFPYGIGCHADGVLIYDISAYSNIYTSFIGYAGISSHMTSGDVTFRFYLSNDNVNWDLALELLNINSRTTKLFNIDVRDKQYLKIVFDSNGNNSQDHSILGKAMLAKEGYDLGLIELKQIKSIKEYDELLAGLDTKDAINNHSKEIYLREFLSRYGDKTELEMAASSFKSMANTLNWLFSDNDALRMLVDAGEVQSGAAPYRGYGEILVALDILYNEFKADFNDPNKVDAHNYKKMLIALAVAYGGDRALSALRFGSYDVRDDLVTRFTNFKYLYKNKFLRRDDFNNYNMELMRLVMNTGLDNADLLWLQGYSELRYPDEPNERIRYYNYLKYGTPIYDRLEYWDEANRKTFDERYHLSEFNIPYGNPHELHYWMVVESPGLCWNLSRFGSDLMRVHGIPTLGSFQPGHESVLEYMVGEDGKGKWGHGYNVLGWGKSYSIWNWGNYYRAPLGWNLRENALRLGNVDKKHNTNYILTAQDFMNQDSYMDSMLYNYLAKAYDTNDTKLYKLYNEALALNSLNIEAFDGLISLYEASNKTSSEWYDLGVRAVDLFKHHPHAFDDYITLINPHLNDLERVNLNNLRVKSLNNLKDYQDTLTDDGKGISDVARAILNDGDDEVFSFSFDGKDANTILINPKYENTNLVFKYSLDGGKSYKLIEGLSKRLTKDELALITSDNDIKVVIEGISEPYTLDIKPGLEVKEFEANDLENRVVGEVLPLEYSLDGVSFNEYLADTRFNGNQEVYFRYKAINQTLESKAVKVSFTTSGDEFGYINVSDIEFVRSGTEAENQSPGFSNLHLIDGSFNTKYHSMFGWNATDKSYTIKFNEPRNFSRFTYESAKGEDNGKIKDIEIYTSLDDKEYKLAASAKNWAKDETMKELIIPNPEPTLYVKIVPTETHNYNKWLSGRRFSFYEAPISLTINNVSGLKDSFNFTGSAIKQSLSVSYNDKTLVENIDYLVEYENNINPGKALVTIKGINKYSGNISYEYEIIKAEEATPNNNDSNKSFMPYVYSLIAVVGLAGISTALVIIFRRKKK